MPEEDAVAGVPAQECPDRQRWDRVAAAEKLLAYQATAGVGGERTRAAVVDVPRSTARGWEERFPAADEQARFFESPAGLRLLQRVTLAATMVFEVPGTDGVRKVAQFLELSGLGRHVAHSRGWLHKFSVATMEQLGAFEAHVLAQLKAGRKTKLFITLCLDETFHPRVCLVAMEPVSGFILVERYAEKRDVETWLAALQEGLEGLDVEVLQATSDEGKALLYLANVEWEAQHSPDVMHVQHEIAKGTMAALNAQQRAAQKRWDGASADTQACVAAQAAAPREPRSPGRPLDHAHRVSEAQAVQEQARAQLEQTTTNREQMLQVIRGISQEDHPYDLKTGECRSDTALESKLDGLLQHARDVVERANLAQRCADAVEKAGRVFPNMVHALQFFHRMVAEHVAALPVGAELQTAVLLLLIPALYLQRAARKARPAETGDAIHKVAQRLLDKLHATPAWLQLDEATRDVVMKSATWCADLFQRSSSCVEGRNGQLALFHHALHHLSDAKLHALTIIHNYFLRRPDGTTAAARFFGTQHEDLFEWLLSRVPMPPSPAPHNARGELNTRRKLKRLAAREATQRSAEDTRVAA